jgi:peptidyl-prolyl cis-trans isomerase SDCCAG10
MFILGTASPKLSYNAPRQLYARLSGTLDPTTKEATMSSVYATEPATSARVIFETTHGPLDIKLWCRECPATTKLFLQLCLDGFYDGMLFHRIVPSLLIQTGALRRRGEATTTATMPSGGDGNSMEKYRQEVQAEEALERRAFELNPRIRFNHRGQVAMALEVDGITDAKDMQPQFFITTESAPYLDRKHVIFGTLGSGSPTVFNAIRISGVAVDEGTNQPVELDQAPRITSTKIVESEIHTDLVPKSIVPWRPANKLSDDDVKKEKKKSKRKGKYDTNVLSFGDEVEDLAPLVKRPKSQKKQDERTIEQQESVYPAAREHDDWASEAVSCKADTAPEISVVPGPSQAPTDTVKSSGRPERSVVPTTHAEDVNSVTDEPIVSIIEQRRARFAKKKTNKQQREDETLAKLMKFRGKLKESVLASSGPPLSSSSNDQDNSLAARMARQAESSKGQSSRTDHATEAYQGQILHSDNNEEEIGSAWLQTRFKCKRHMDNAAGEKEDEYEVIDEKGKSRDRDRRKK